MYINTHTCTCLHVHAHTHTHTQNSAPGISSPSVTSSAGCCHGDRWHASARGDSSCCCHAARTTTTPGGRRLLHHFLEEQKGTLCGVQMAQMVGEAWSRLFGAAGRRAACEQKAQCLHKGLWALDVPTSFRVSNPPHRVNSGLEVLPLQWFTDSGHRRGWITYKLTACVMLPFSVLLLQDRNASTQSLFFTEQPTSVGESKRARAGLGSVSSSKRVERRAKTMETLCPFTLSGALRTSNRRWLANVC